MTKTKWSLRNLLLVEKIKQTFQRRSRCRLVKAQYFMSLQEQGRGRTGSLPGGNSISREEDEEIVFPGGRKGNFEHPTVPKSIAKCFTLLTVRKN